MNNQNQNNNNCTSINQDEFIFSCKGKCKKCKQQKEVFKDDLLCISCFLKTKTIKRGNYKCCIQKITKNKCEAIYFYDGKKRIKRKTKKNKYPCFGKIDLQTFIFAYKNELMERITT